MFVEFIAKGVENANCERMENGRCFANRPDFIGGWAEVGLAREEARGSLAA